MVRNQQPSIAGFFKYVGCEGVELQRLSAALWLKHGRLHANHPSDVSFDSNFRDRLRGGGHLREGVEGPSPVLRYGVLVANRYRLASRADVDHVRLVSPYGLHRLKVSGRQGRIKRLVCGFDRFNV